MSSKPHSKQRQPKGARASSSTSSITDPRFKNIETDPRFKIPSKRQTHVHLDKRFAHLLKDEKFTRKAKVDRYGRKLPKDSGRKELQRFYRIDSDQEEEDEKSLVKVSDPKDVDSDDAVARELERVEKKYDPAREGGFAESSSSSEDSSSSSDEEEDDEEQNTFGLPEQRGEEVDIPTGDVTDRLAIVNLDWDNIRSEDLMAVFSSFVPQGEKILKVSIYPSEFGKERMEREEMEGPPKEIFKPKSKFVENEEHEKDSSDGVRGETHSEDEDENQKDDVDSDSSSEDENEKIKEELLTSQVAEDFNSAELRQYQIDRLRYFYAVLICSSPTCAKAIYDAVDGAEYLSSANFFDLRFIPEDTDFHDDKARDECEKISSKYKPSEFVTSALQHSKVSLTWDADDGARKELQARAFAGGRKEIEENDLRAYLGSDSSDDDDEVVEEDAPEIVDATNAMTIFQSDEAQTADSHGDADDKSKTSEKANLPADKRSRLRALLGLPVDSVSSKSKTKKEKIPVGGLTVTFTPGLSNTVSADPATANASVIEKEETAIEKYVRKERERRTRRKERIRKLKAGENPDVTDTKETENNDAVSEDEKEDLGFDDPFFENPTSSQPQKKDKKRSKNQGGKAPDEEEADAEEIAKQKAELSLLFANDATDPTKASRAVFDIKRLVKAEKEKEKKKGSSKSLRRRRAAATADEGTTGKADDDFHMDVADPRFAKLFSRPELAIDPTNPRFLKTEGMKRLLEEGRKRRHGEAGNEGEENGKRLKQDTTRIKKRKRDGNENNTKRRREKGDGEMSELLERVKRREMRAQEAD